MVSNQDNWTEAKIQQNALVYIRNTYPQTIGCIWHVPNGGLREKVNASILTGQGIIPGIQDVHFLWHGAFYVIEMKDKSGPVSPEQKVIHAKHKLHGKDTYIFRRSDLLISFVEHVIFGKSLDAFAIYISPYSVAANFDQYNEELRIINKRKLDNKLARRYV
jgi:hypothetical protein